MKKNKLILMVMIIIGSSLAFIIFFILIFHKSFAVSLESGTKVASNTDLTYYIDVIYDGVDGVNTMNSVSEVPVNNNLIDASEDVNSREMVKTVASDDNVRFNNEVSVSDVSSEDSTNDTNNTDDIDII